MNDLKTFLIVLLLYITSPGVVKAQENKQPAQLYLTLPEYCPTPDNLSISPDGNLVLSCPNYADKKVPGILVKISKDKKVDTLLQLKGPEGKGFFVPKGIDFDEAGNLYIVDGWGKGSGRLLRVSFPKDKAYEVNVMAKGFAAINGLKYHNGAVYITQARYLELGKENMSSGVYRFETTARDIEILNNANDSNLIFTAQTNNPDRQFGLDGLCFDKKGKLYVGNFGDGTVYQLTLDKKGNMKKAKVYVMLPNTSGIDGMTMDDKGNLYTVGFSMNQVLKVDKKGEVKILAQYPDNNGENGEIDQPADILFYRNQLIITNFDLMHANGMVNSGHTKPYTLSFIPLNSF